jgi:23S rRNA (cytosine1962-C5)-methyltransferase
VLDLCCYTGAFSIAAAVRGGAATVTGVDLDEVSIAQAKRNAALNHARNTKFVHADAFRYGRQLLAANTLYDVVCLDPPKFVAARGGPDASEGRRKYGT